MKNSGLDLVVEQDFIIKSVFTFKEHSYFGETKKDLPKPSKFGNHVLSAKIMDHYDFITKVDLARFLRVVSIILTNFTGPKEDDHFDNHIRRLQDLFKKQTPENETLVMEALLAYDEVLGTKKNLPKEDYINFARILNNQWQIFESKEKIQPSDDFLEDDWAYDDYEDEEIDHAKRISDYADWAYKELFKDFNDEKFLKMLNDDMQRNTLLISLKSQKLGDYTDEQIKQFAKKKKERVELIKKINDWYVKKFPS
ncbi:MAG: hypothetical protein FK730_16280 [Asgard group archaeon]|nr:hypothetical protein [Asgard group archaeon]